MFPADFDAIGDLRANQMPEDLALSQTAYGVYFIIKFKGYSLLYGREIAKRISQKFGVKNNATTHG